MSGTMNENDMNYVLDKFIEIAEILRKLQVQIDLLGIRIDGLETRPC